MTVTTDIVLDDRYLKKKYDENNITKYPVKLRITFARKQKYYLLLHPSTKQSIDLSPEDFERVMGQKPRNDHKELRLVLNAAEEKAQGLIKDIADFSFAQFEKNFKHKSGDKKNVALAFDRYIEELERSGRLGTASSYNCAKGSFASFKNENLAFNEIDVSFLNDYEQWMIKIGNSITTVGIYSRCLRTIINKAIAGEIVKQSDYPFGKNKYTIPASRNIKKALQVSEIAKIFKYAPPVHSREDKAKDFWILSYLCNGINMKDIALLKRENMHKDFIEFNRAKTVNTSKSNSKPISIFLTPDIKKIIKKWGNTAGEPEDYIFPILQRDLTPKRQREVIQQFIKNINNWISKIAADLKIEKKVTTYTARHSFSTVLKRAGASIEFISESLGHTDVRTTQRYLDSFESARKKKFAKALTSFK